MKYKLSILNVAAVIFLLAILIDAFIRYRQLASGEGWGIVGTVGLAGVGAGLLVIDFLIQLFVKTRVTVNILGAVIAMVVGFFLYYG